MVVRRFLNRRPIQPAVGKMKNANARADRTGMHVIEKTLDAMQSVNGHINKHYYLLDVHLRVREWTGDCKELKFIGLER